jgi:hypothetical protein
MKQSVAMYFGACVGAVLWFLLRGGFHVPGLFLCIIIAAWVGIGAFGLLRGQVVIAGRGGRSPKALTGVPARLVGFFIITASAVFTAIISSMGNK